MSVKEEIFWPQRSKIKWLKEGDRNTKFFHKVASQHKNNNNIQRIWLNGEWVQNQDVIHQEVEEYYMNLFKEEHPIRLLLDGLEFNNISGVEKKLVERPFLEVEVSNSIMRMKGDKALGLDGFSISFF